MRGNSSIKFPENQSLPVPLESLGVLASEYNASTIGYQLGGNNRSSMLDPIRQGSNPGELPQFNEFSLIKTCVLSLLFLVSLIGNGATLIQMYRMRRRKSTIHTLILQLAMADLIVTFFCIATDAIWTSTVQFYAGNVMCKITKFLQVFGLYLSTYILVIISVDRCYAILDPMSRTKAPRRVRYMIIVAWSISALFSLPQVSEIPLPFAPVHAWRAFG